MRHLAIAAALGAAACEPSTPPPMVAAVGQQQPTPQQPPTFDLRLVRQMPPGAPLERDGDYAAWSSMARGTLCASLYKTTPYEAVFVVCGDQVVAGPLTTEAEIRGVFAQLHAELERATAMQIDQSRQAYEIGRTIRASWPTGCSNCKYRVYDARGNHVRDE